MATHRSPGHRAGLTSDAVVEAARALLADEGVSRLTMRSLADRLQVHPNTLYSHVSGKDDLLERVVDSVLAGVWVPDDSVGWRDGLLELMRSTYDELLAHEEVVPVLLGRGSRGVNAQRLGVAVVDLLARGGIEGDAAERALQVLIVFVIGFAAFASRAAAEDPDHDARRLRMRRNYDAGLCWLVAGIALDARTGMAGEPVQPRTGGRIKRKTTSGPSP